MAFIDIEDPKKRDEIVADYLSTVKRIQQRNEDEKAIGLAKQVDLENTFKPIIKATEKSTEAITKGLEPIKEEVLNLRENLDARDEELPRKRRRTGTEYDGYGPLARQFKSKILTRDPDVDTSFGIRFEDNGETAMGNKWVTIQGDNLIVGDQVYIGTEGLWTLITGVTEDQIGSIGQNYSELDLLEYIKLVKQTNVMHRNFDPTNPHPRSSNSWKWKYFLKNLWDQFRKHDEKEGEIIGSGIQFLPGDIKGLSTKLNLLLAEFVAGNRSSTRNEIVGILDELLRRKGISRTEYRDINTYLSKTQ